MDTQTKDKVRQLVAQVMLEEQYQGAQWDPYPQPRDHALLWDMDGLDYAMRRNGHRPPVYVADDERVLKR
ncbi:MAG TPA: hypothetical protein PKH77_11815 [Anaerolineae bacterium]|nr:hypothetical protein [Anaerolineae bacterium]